MDLRTRIKCITYLSPTKLSCSRLPTYGYLYALDIDKMM